MPDTTNQYLVCYTPIEYERAAWRMNYQPVVGGFGYQDQRLDWYWTDGQNNSESVNQLYINIFNSSLLFSKARNFLVYFPKLLIDRFFISRDLHTSIFSGSSDHKGGASIRMADGQFKYQFS
jgi:hypothetical protein